LGAAKKRREAFFREHPFCCFCGGGTPAETIDHVPLRAAFAGNVGPEDFEFPACHECNGGTSGSEQVFALYVRLCDQTDANYNQGHVKSLIRGVRNNYPDLMPDPNLPANEKRRALRHFGWERERGSFLHDIGMIAVPEGVGRHMEVNATKLLAALHYRHLGLSLTDDAGIVAGWSQQGLPGVEEARDVLFSGMPQLVVGARVNTSIGDQFAYRWGQNEAEGLFGFGAEFGTGLFLFAAAAPWSVAAGMEDWARYTPPRSP